ncbi:MAG: helix-turn-helix domain-containing protein [Gemmatimonadales bacterium]
MTTIPDRFREGSQGQILVHLQGGGATVDDLARLLELTPNGVRAHLAALEREGLVAVEGKRPGLRKPALIYGLTALARERLSRAYFPLLQELLATLKDRLTPAERVAVLREAGRRLAAAAPRVSGPRRERVAVAEQVLEQLGGKVRMEARGRSTALVGSACPLAELVRENPEVCRAVEALVAEVTGLPAKEECDRGAHPRCTFVVG